MDFIKFYNENKSTINVVAGVAVAAIAASALVSGIKKSEAAKEEKLCKRAEEVMDGKAEPVVSNNTFDGECVRVS